MDHSWKEQAGKNGATKHQLALDKNKENHRFLDIFWHRCLNDIAFWNRNSLKKKEQYLISIEKNFIDAHIIVQCIP